MKSTLFYIVLLAITLITYPLHADTNRALMGINNSQDAMFNKILPGFMMQVDASKQIVSLHKTDNSAFVSMQLLKPIPYINTLKQYTEHVMKYYQGSHLTIQAQRRGYSFRYYDTQPCVALVTFFDGTSYLMMNVCGKLEQDEVTRALNVAKKQLGLDELLQRSSRPNVYY